MIDPTKPRALEISITSYNISAGEGVSENKAKSRSRVTADLLFHARVMDEGPKQPDGPPQVAVLCGSVDGRTGQPMSVAQLFQTWVAFTTHLKLQSDAIGDVKTSRFFGVVLGHMEQGVGVIVKGEESVEPKASHLSLVPPIVEDDGEVEPLGG